MRRFFFIALIAVISMPTIVKAWNVPDEDLHYNVRFHWGFIDANVGVATITTRNIPSQNAFTATMYGKSVDLLGHYYAAGDTITGTIMTTPNATMQDQQILAENGQFAIETITSPCGGNESDGPIIATLPNGNVIHSRISNYGSGVTVDLLSPFYYIRQIDYNELSPQETTTINLSNSQGIDRLNITYLGTQTIEINGQNVDTYAVNINFTDQTSGKTDILEAWISADENRIPVLIKGSISVGSMVCTYIPY